MKMADIGCYIQSLWDNKISVAISAIAITIFNFLFPTSEYRLAAIAVFGVMALDIITKVFSTCLYGLTHGRGGYSIVGSEILDKIIRWIIQNNSQL